MTEFIRTPDENFADLPGYAFEPNYHNWQDLRMHYVDEGPKDGHVMLLLHGMPTWAYLYRDVIPVLTEAGYRIKKMTLVDQFPHTSHIETVVLYERF